MRSRQTQTLRPRALESRPRLPHRGAQWIGRPRGGQREENPDSRSLGGLRPRPRHLRRPPPARRRKLYLLLYKPKGYLTTYKDPEGRPTVYDLLTDVDEWIFPVGRLDQDTSGLLIMTNDSTFGDYITSPESKVPKTYLVKASMLLTRRPTGSVARTASSSATAPRARLRCVRVRESARFTFFEITITEGRNRQVRRMVEALGAKVLKLVRTRIGAIEIAGLEIGKHRPLTRDEVISLVGQVANLRPIVNRPQIRKHSPKPYLRTA